MPLLTPFALAGTLLAGTLLAAAPAAPAASPAPTQATAAPAPAVGRLTIELRGLRPARGKARMALYRTEEGFPMDYKVSFRLVEVAVSGAQATLVVEGLPPGRYAAAIYHDANGNDELDTNFLGIPKEGLGVSNDAKGSFGPPKFRDAAFSFDGTERRLTVTMKYL